MCYALGVGRLTSTERIGMLVAFIVVVLAHFLPPTHAFIAVVIATAGGFLFAAFI